MNEEQVGDEEQDGDEKAVGVIDRAIGSHGLRRRLTLTLVGAVLVSVLVLGGFNYWAARSALGDELDEQLDALRAEQTLAIRTGLNRSNEAVAVGARDLGVVEALRDLSAAATSVGSEVTVDAEGRAELAGWYETNVLAPAATIDIDLGDVDDLLPAADLGRALQLRYVAESSDAPDIAEYERAHDTHDAFLRSFAERDGLDDLLLVDAEGVVVYSVSKNIDFGTDLVDGPSNDSHLAVALREVLPKAPVGDGVFVDFRRYLPAAARPVMFVAAAVRDDTEVIGAIAAALDIELLNQLTTANRSWEEIGLGDGGETYIVGPDGLMRSDSRLWIEDPEAYLAQLGDDDARLAELVSAFDSTVLLQPVETEAVEAAASGDRFSGTTRNYLGVRTRTVAGPMGIDGLDWVIVGDVPTSQTNDAINSYLRNILILAAVLVPAVAIGSAWLARRLTRPVPPLLEAADRVAAGDLTTEAPDVGADELGDLARRLNALTARLRSEEEALAREEAATAEMLLAALPPRLVEQVRGGERRLEEVVDRATVVSITTVGVLDDASDEEEGLELASELSRRLEETAEDMGIERVRSSSDHHLFTAGLGVDDDGADAAAAFILAVRDAVGDLDGETANEIGLHAGLATGDMATGVVGSDQLSFGVWGEPARAALALDAVAGRGQVLAAAETVEALGDEWDVEPLRELADLSGAPVRASELLGRRR